MANNALFPKAIALTEKKMDMTLDDIIKMSKKASSKGKKLPRASNKSQGFLNDFGARHNNKVQRFMNSKSSIRQGLLAQRRLNFKGNQFPVTNEVGRSAVAPVHNRAINPHKHRIAAALLRRSARKRNFIAKNKETIAIRQKRKTLDALFANMKEQRLQTMTNQMVRGRGWSAIQGHARGFRQQHAHVGAADAGVRFG